MKQSQGWGWCWVSWTDTLSDTLSYTTCGNSLTSWGGKCLIYSARNASIFKAISASKIDKVYLTSFEIIFKYVSANQEMYSLHVCARPIFSYHIFTCFTLRRHSNVIDNLKTVMWRLFFFRGGFWLDKPPFESCNHWSCLLILFGCVSTRLSRLDTNCRCLHSKYLQTAWPSTSDLYHNAVMQNYSSDVCYYKNLTEIRLKLHPEI